jgi:cob(I)alamin adenosyltransferase
MIKSMIQVYTGNGKGKTTAALGIAFRALGYEKKVFMVQFMKSAKSGELFAARKFSQFKIVALGRNCLLDKKSLSPQDTILALKAFSCARDVILSGKYDILILDELNTAVNFGLLKVRDVMELIEAAPKNLEIIITGRNAPREFVEAADLVSEIIEIKHYYQRGVKGRKGIEY